jgi:hypothetical protein
MIDYDNDNFAMVPLAATGTRGSNTAGGEVSSFGAIFDPSAPNALTPPINFTAVAGLEVYTDQTVDSFPNFGVATTGSSLYWIGVQIPPALTGVVSYDLNTLKRQVAFSKRIIATHAGVKDLPGVTFADVAVGP